MLNLIICFRLLYSRQKIKIFQKFLIFRHRSIHRRQHNQKIYRRLFDFSKQKNRNINKKQ